MENLRFKIRFRRFDFYVAGILLSIGIFFFFEKGYKESGIALFFVSFFFLIALFKIWDYFKFQKIKESCQKTNKNTFEIPFSKIKEIIPLNDSEYSIKTHNGVFSFTSGYVQNFKLAEEPIIQKLEKEPFLIIETPFSDFSKLFIVAVIYKLILGFIFNSEMDWKLSLPAVLPSIFGIFLIMDLVFKTSTNSFFKKFIKIPKTDILSYSKTSFGFLKLKTKFKTMWIWSSQIGNHRIERYLVRNGISNTAKT